MRILEALLLLAVALIAAAGAQAGTVTYFHNDLVGSPVVASDAAGQVLWQESYRPYGERLANPESANRLWYAGHAQDAQTGLVCMGARWYDPVAGRFVSVDPKAFDEANVQSFNRYAYANNNPYRYVDPDGRAAETIFDVISFGISVEMFRRDPTIGNFLGAAVDGLAVAIPFMPGGVGSIRAVGKAAEAADTAVTAAKAGAHNAANASKLGKQLASQEGVAELLSGGGKAIAGAGTSIPLRDAGRLVGQYGGNANDWAKISSTAQGHLQTHAYRNVVTGQVVELKSIAP